MRAWKVTSFGEPGDVLSLEDDAKSFDPRSGQLKIAVEAAGLGLPDVFMCRNTYPMTPKLPFVPSQEAVGRVIAVGDGVDEALMGTRVLGPTLFRNRCGGLAEECLMPAMAAFPVPDAMSAEEAAGFYIPYQTAWVGLIQRAKLTADDSLLVLGASGSSGCAAVQLAKAVGARVIAVAGGPDKAAFCRSIGADEVVDHRSQDITEATRELTDGKGVNVVFDPVGGEPGRSGFLATAFEGRFVIIGFAAGEWAKIHLAETLPTNISLLGAMPIGFAPQVFQQAHGELMGYWEQGKLKVIGNQVFDFEDGCKAIQHIANGKVEGKVVVRVK